MRPGRLFAVSIGLVAVCGVVSALAAGGVSSGKATMVAGLGTSAVVNSLSCGGAGNCAAGGVYRDGANVSRAFVVDEVNGVWGDAVEVPGTATLDGPSIESVSCAAAGECVAGGSYDRYTGSDYRETRSFVVDEKNGIWGSASAPEGSMNSRFREVSCASADNCAAVGQALDSMRFPVAAVVWEERNGVWGGATTLWSDGSSVSCGSARNCVVIGDTSRVDEKDGVWGQPIEYTRFNSLSVSCGSAGNCATVGIGFTGTPKWHAFVADEKKGVWGKARVAPYLSKLGSGVVSHGSKFTTGSCASAGNCAAVGWYTYDFRHSQAFVADEKNGVWGPPRKMPGTAAVGSRLDPYSAPLEVEVSCGRASNCEAGGSYKPVAGHQAAFLADEKNGVWGKAHQVQGLPALNVGGYAAVTSISCANAGNCAASGYYKDGSGHQQPFLVNKKNGVWGNAIKVPGF